MVIQRTRFLGALVLFVALLPALARASGLDLAVDDISAPGWRASRISFHVAPGARPGLTLSVGKIAVYGRVFENVDVRCGEVHLTPDLIDCRNGSARSGGGPAWPLAFRFWPRKKQALFSLRPDKGEEWRAALDFGARRQFRLDIADGHLNRLAPWLPKNQPRPSSGLVNGSVVLAFGGKPALTARADMHVSQAAFADIGGLHAGERLGLSCKLEAEQAGDGWDWQAQLVWRDGEVFWNPLYLVAAGQTLDGRGHWGSSRLRVEQATLAVPGLGTATAQGTWSEAGGVTEADAQARNLDLSVLFASLVRPFLAKTALAKAEAAGRLSFSGQIADGKPAAMDLALDGAALRDPEGRFSLQGVQFDLPWRADSDVQAKLTVGGGKLLSLDIGAFSTAAQLRGGTVAIPVVAVPILDGRLDLQDFLATNTEHGWEWQFEGGLTPVSMEQLSQALHWPTMRGTLAGVIPRVHYADGKLRIDGALLVKAFDGTIVIQDLVLLDPLGRAPRLAASLDMRRLDLDLLTRAFSFGSIQGRVDVAVKGLELSAWQPVAFDASIRSSEGSYPRKISQRAVQNISALGGAGAAAAIQRSFLGIFEEFGYSRLGLSCVLRDGVCRMDGIEAAPQGYVIVKGGGIPAITVIGYNRSVGWDELLTRLKRVTQGNAKPVVQ